MTLFSSKKEKQLWLLVLLVVLTIFSTLLFGQPLLEIFGNQNVQAALFLLGMLLTAGFIFYNGFKSNSSSKMIGVFLGLLAVYLLLFLRLGLAERTHLMEYSVLAVFIYQALSERHKNGFKVIKPAFLATGITCLIGVLDEFMQLFIPNRVFDLNDIIFNCLAALAAIISTLSLEMLRNKMK